MYFLSWSLISVRVIEHDISARADQGNKNSKLHIELVKLSFQEETGGNNNTHRGKIFTLTL